MPAAQWQREVGEQGLGLAGGQYEGWARVETGLGAAEEAETELAHGVPGGPTIAPFARAWTRTSTDLERPPCDPRPGHDCANRAATATEALRRAMPPSSAGGASMAEHIPTRGVHHF